MKPATIALLNIKDKWVDLRKFDDEKLGKTYYIVREYYYKEEKIQLVRATYEMFEEEIAVSVFKDFSLRVLAEI